MDVHLPNRTFARFLRVQNWRFGDLQVAERSLWGHGATTVTLMQNM
jgi:hypothetical protein